MKTTLQNVSLAQLERAFEAWENGCRVNPDAYRSADVIAGLDVNVVSAERADYFHELLTLEQAKA